MLYIYTRLRLYFPLIIVKVNVKVKVKVKIYYSSLVFYIARGSFGKDSALMEPRKKMMRSF